MISLAFIAISIRGYTLFFTLHLRNFHMIRICTPLFFVLTLGFSLTSSYAEPTHSVGLGVHYWRVLDDIDIDNFQESGLSYLAAYRYDGGLLAFQGEVEYFSSDFGVSTESVYSPQFVVILGDGIFAAIGAGILYTDGEFANKPYYLLRAGFNIIHIGPVALEINANYLFTDFSSFSTDDIKSDTITLGAMARLEF